MSEYSYFSGFAWALPLAFREPLGACLFEEGDTLYNCKEGYLPWKTALDHLHYSVTVTLPRKSLGKNTLKEGESVVFNRNWYTKVEFDLKDYKAGTERSVKSTQGRLYSFLRTADFNLLDEDSLAPNPPILVVAANDRLENIQGAISALIATEAEESDLFLMAFDITNPVSRAKPDAIRACLRQDHITAAERTLSLEEVGLPNWEMFAPTISILVFCVDGRTGEGLRDSLKRALYRPVKGKATKREYFNLRRHGLFVPAQKPNSVERITERALL